MDNELQKLICTEMCHSIKVSPVDEKQYARFLDEKSEKLFKIAVGIASKVIEELLHKDCMQICLTIATIATVTKECLKK